MTKAENSDTDQKPFPAIDDADAPEEADGELPRTLTRPELMPDGTDREFRQFVHRLLAFSTRIEAVRSGFGNLIGLSGIQYSALISIAHLGKDSIIGVKEVADHLSLSGSFATLVVSQLVTLGLVDKTPNPDDRRRVCLNVTPKGLELLRKLAPVQREINDLLFGPLDAKRFHDLNEIFKELVRSGDASVGLIDYLTGIEERSPADLPRRPGSKSG